MYFNISSPHPPLPFFCSSAVALQRKLVNSFINKFLQELHREIKGQERKKKHLVRHKNGQVEKRLLHLAKDSGLRILFPAMPACEEGNDKASSEHPGRRMALHIVEPCIRSWVFLALGCLIKKHWECSFSFYNLAILRTSSKKCREQRDDKQPGKNSLLCFLLRLKSVFVLMMGQVEHWTN